MDAKILQSRTVNDGAAKKKEKVQMIVLGVLLLLMVVLGFKTFFKGKPKQVVLPVPPPAASLPVPVEETESVKVPELEDWGSSPFSFGESGDKAKVPQMTLILQGIVYSPDAESFAMISENIVKKGDKVADNTVVEISSNSVTLKTAEGETVTLNQ